MSFFGDGWHVGSIVMGNVPTGLFATYFFEVSSTQGQNALSRIDTQTRTVAATSYGDIDHHLSSDLGWHVLNEQFGSIGFLDNGSLVTLGYDRVSSASGGFFIGSLPSPWGDTYRFVEWADTEGLTNPTRITLENYLELTISGNFGTGRMVTDGSMAWVDVSGSLSTGHFRHALQPYSPTSGLRIGTLADQTRPLMRLAPDGTTFYSATAGGISKGTITGAQTSFWNSPGGGIQDFNINDSTGELFVSNYDENPPYAPIITRVSTAGVEVQRYYPTVSAFDPDLNGSYIGAIAAHGNTVYCNAWMVHYSGGFVVDAENADGIWFIDIESGSGTADPALQLGIPPASGSPAFYEFAVVNDLAIGRG